MSIRAQELNGTHIGKKIEYYKGGLLYVTDEITMIIHKKNLGVRVRHGKNGREPEFRPMDLVEVVSLTPPTYYATLTP